MTQYAAKGSSKCSPCLAGHECPHPAQQWPCPDGFYSDVDGTTHCKACPSCHSCGNKSAVPAKCASGRYSMGKQVDCTDCPLGFKCPTCDDYPTPCPSGTATTCKSSTDCPACGAGHFCPTPSQRIPCPSGTYANLTDQVRAHAYPANTSTSYAPACCVYQGMCTSLSLSLSLSLCVCVCITPISWGAIFTTVTPISLFGCTRACLQ